MTQNNRRSADRYVLRMPLRYRATAQWQRGHTVDISARGMLLDIPDSPPAGSRLEVDMDWPGVYFGRKKVRLFVIGMVTRVDERGTALRFARHEFRSLDAGRLPAVTTAYAEAGSAPIGA